MNSSQDDQRSDVVPAGRSAPALQVLIWSGFVALAVAGRFFQPEWHFTPLAAVTLAAGFVFPSVLVAAAVPVAALAISNCFLAPHDSLAMAAVVYAATAWPVLLGACGLLGRCRQVRWPAVIGGSLASSLVFFFTTNAAHWWLTNQYPHSASGLVECLAAGLPFYRWMPVGDLAWTVIVFGGLSLLAAPRPVPAGATATARLD
jgi:hypothetical protein